MIGTRRSVLPRALRREVPRAHDVGREPGLGVGLEEVELAGERIADLTRELAPVVGRERAGQVEDLAVGGGRHVPAEVDAVEAEPARDREVLGGEIDEERTALVRRSRRARSASCEQRVADDDARDLPGAEDARAPRERR